MHIYNILLQYSFTAIAGIICCILIVLQGRDALKEKPLYVTTAIFVFNIVIISLLMWSFYSLEVIFNHYNVIHVIRAFDYFTYSFLLFSWVELLRQLCLETKEHVNTIYFIIGKLVSITGAVIFIVIALVFMNDVYYISNASARMFYHLAEFIFGIIAIILVVICAYKACTVILISNTKNYVVIASAAMIAYMIMQIYVSGAIGSIDVLMWGPNAKCFSGWALFTLNLSTCWFIYKKDFQKVYSPSEKYKQIPLSTDEALDKVAAMHRLTQREREIIELVYSGASNAEISENLFISLNTVKSHMRNIFEKLGVSSRMELSHIINNQLHTDN